MSYDLAEAAKDPVVTYFNRGASVYMDYTGDVLHLFDIKKSAPDASDYAEQICKLLNEIPKKAKR